MWRVQNYLLCFLMPPALYLWITSQAYIALSWLSLTLLKGWELCACINEAVGTGPQLLSTSCVDVVLLLYQGIQKGLSLAPLRPGIPASAQVALALYGSSHPGCSWLPLLGCLLGAVLRQKEINKTQLDLSKRYLSQ